jgi:(1->4)-alpha-D-glucan 1-alpha-D-glucosylmutase
MYVTRNGLHFRRSHAALFLKGDYIPLQVQGSQRDCVVAFARRYRGNWCLVVVPCFTSRLRPSDGQSIGNWEDTRVLLPKRGPTELDKHL